jgi:hypothetical protein
MEGPAGRSGESDGTHMLEAPVFRVEIEERTEMKSRRRLRLDLRAGATVARSVPVVLLKSGSFFELWQSRTGVGKDEAG